MAAFGDRAADIEERNRKNQAGAAPPPNGPPAPSGGQGATDPNTGLSNGGRATPAAGTGGAGTFVDTATGKPVTPTGLGGFDQGLESDFGTAGGVHGTAVADAGKTLEDLKAASAPTTRAAPQVTPTPGVTTEPIMAAKPTAATAAAPSSVGRPVITTTPGVTAGTVNAATIAPTQTALATDATAARFNTDPQAQVRARQFGLLDTLEGAAAGTGAPSAAQILGKQQADDAVAQQLGLVSLNHGRGQGGALRTAGQSIAKLQSDAARTAALTKAQEQATARGQLLSALEGTRGQDIGVAGKEADLNQAVNLQNAAQRTDVSKFNAGNDVTKSIEGAKLEQAAGTRTTELALDAAKSNQQTDAERAKAEADLQLRAALGDQDAQTKIALANAANETQTSIVGATETNKVGMNNQEQQLRADLANADNQTKVALANAGFTLQGREIDDARNVAAIKAMLEGQAQYITGADQLAKNQLAREQLDEAIRRGDREAVMQIIGTVLQVGGTIAAAAMSDRRMKTDVRPLYSDEQGKSKKSLLDALEGGGGDDVGELLDKIKPYAFKYKDTSAPGTAPGQRYGVMAQDLEKSPMGKSIVINVGGHKAIDTPQAVGVILASMARMQERLKKVERR